MQNRTRTALTAAQQAELRRIADRAGILTGPEVSTTLYRPAAPRRFRWERAAAIVAALAFVAAGVWAVYHQATLAEERRAACAQALTAADAISKDSRVNWAELQVVVDAAQGYGSMADAEAPLAAREARLAKAQADYAQAKAVCTR